MRFAFIQRHCKIGARQFTQPALRCLRPAPQAHGQKSVRCAGRGPIAFLAALSAACAANGVPLREPLKPIAPALGQKDNIFLVIGDRHDGVIKSRVDVHHPFRDILAAALFAPRRDQRLFVSGLSIRLLFSRPWRLP